MEYPKKLMKISELEKMGYSKELLKKWVHFSDFPCRKFGKHQNSPFFVDTEKFENWQRKKGFIKGG